MQKFLDFLSEKERSCTYTDQQLNEIEEFFESLIDFQKATIMVDVESIEKLVNKLLLKAIKDIEIEIKP